MTAEKRQTDTAALKREAVRLGLAHGYAMTAATRHREGRRRMAQPLQDGGVAVGRDHARRWMRQAKVTGHTSQEAWSGDDRLSA